jgi:RNA polymerase subunit RPABC4/transcription elongation factor Spt4
MNKCKRCGRLTNPEPDYCWRCVPIIEREELDKAVKVILNHVKSQFIALMKFIFFWGFTILGTALLYYLAWWIAMGLFFGLGMVIEFLKQSFGFM